MKKYIRLLLVVGFLLFAAAVYLMFSGPRMEYQYKIKTFESLCSPPPPGTVPVEMPLKMPAENITNPLSKDQASIEKGKIYYGYYCLFCHGEKGKGDGDVGQSYYPRPTDLKSDRVRSFTDSKLYAAMLTGVGHEPVLERVVLQRFRWHIVLYIRSLQNSNE